LSVVLEDLVHPRFYLSALAMGGILRRASMRGRDLPGPLRALLLAGAAEGWETMAEEEAEAALALWDESPEASAGSTSRAPSGVSPPAEAAEPPRTAHPRGEVTDALVTSRGPSPPGTARGSTPPPTTGPSSVAFHLTQDPTHGPQVPALTRKGGGQGVMPEPMGFPTDAMVMMDPLRADGQSPTVNAAAPPATDHRAALRKLTPTECERLMGWPDHWTVLGKRRSRS
jgi:site-specific DNA-cytosine methylase